MSRIATIDQNLKLVSQIMTSGDLGKIHAELDKLIDSIKITYESKQDFRDNFPDQDDLSGKIRLIVRRRQ